MPVTGLPDRKIHRLCWNCRCWFHLHEGILDFPPVTGPLSFLFSLSGRMLEDESKRRFYCLPCHEKVTIRAKHQRQTLQWTSIGMVVAGFVIYIVWAMGYLQLR